MLSFSFETNGGLRNEMKKEHRDNTSVGWKALARRLLGLGGDRRGCCDGLEIVEEKEGQKAEENNRRASRS